MAKELEDAGAAALVMYSLFEEEVRAAEDAPIHFLPQDGGEPDDAAGSQAEAKHQAALDRYLEQLIALKSTLSVPVIASLNAVTLGGWVDIARQLESAGADALELNIYYIAADVEESGLEVEQRYVDVVEAVRGATSIPLNVKMSPSFSSVAHMVRRIEQAGANGVSLFNRYYQPDINIHNLRLMPTLHPSTSAEAQIAMRWIAILHDRTSLSLGATGGIHTAADAVKLLLAGADVIHMCSALLMQGPGYLATIVQGIRQWMDEMGFSNVSQFRGRVSQSSVPDPSAFERANYLRILDSYSLGKTVRI